MFGEVSCARDSASVLEDRKLLQQLVSLGVGYPYGKSWFSKAAITDTNTLQCQISRELYSRKYSDAGSIIREIKDRIRNGDDGYYFLDLDKGRILAKGQHPIEDMIVDFTISGADDRVLLRRRIGACLHNAGFVCHLTSSICYPSSVQRILPNLALWWTMMLYKTTDRWFSFHVKKTATSYNPS